MLPVSDLHSTCSRCCAPAGTLNVTRLGPSLVHTPCSVLDQSGDSGPQSRQTALHAVNIIDGSLTATAGAQAPPDPTIVASAFQRQRLYIFSKREPADYDDAAVGRQASTACTRATCWPEEPIEGSGSLLHSRRTRLQRTPHSCTVACLLRCPSMHYILRRATFGASPEAGPRPRRLRKGAVKRQDKALQQQQRAACCACCCQSPKPTVGPGSGEACAGLWICQPALESQRPCSGPIQPAVQAAAQSLNAHRDLFKEKPALCDILAAEEAENGGPGEHLRSLVTHTTISNPRPCC